MNVIRIGFQWFSGKLADIGLIDRYRGERTVDLAWPRIVTGFARLSQQVADLAMIGLVLGPAAIAGMAFAFAYWQIGNRLSLGLSGGTISLVSQRFGAEDLEGVDTVTKQSYWLGIVMAVPIVGVYWTVPDVLISILGASPAATGFGALYLSVVSLALGFEFINKISSRVLVGMDDAVTPMLIRATGAFTNIVLNAIFIFGLGLGVLGAALGTVLATVFTTLLFLIGFFHGELPRVREFPITLSTTAPNIDLSLARQLLVVSIPLMARSLASSIVIFPLLAIVSVFGTGAVAAFEVARRLRSFMNAPGWGFGLASSSLVGQELGTGDEAEADAYGWDILRFAIVTYLAIAILAIILARPLSRVFVSQPGVLDQTVVFVRVAAIAVIGLGVDSVATGTLRGAGDTRWPFYGKFAGLYLFALPIAYLGVITPLGIYGVYLAFIAETLVPAAVSYFRFWRGDWIAVSREYRPPTA